MLTGFALVGLAVGLAFFNFPTMPSSSGDSGPAIPGLTEFVGSEAPGFDLRTLDGDALQLTDLRGRVVLLNFWATWCGPCRVEMPDLQARADRWTDRLTIVGVNFDEPEADVRTFRDELGLTFPIVLDPGAKVQNLYRIVGYPTTILIDSQGVVRVQHVGLMSPDQLDKYLAQMGLAG
jgi:peroxiredoxin